MDKISKIVFSAVIALLLFCAIRMFAQAEEQLRSAETVLAGLHTQAEELRRENDILLEALYHPGDIVPDG